MAPSSYIYTGPDSSLIIHKTTLHKGVPTELEGRAEKAAKNRKDIKKASKQAPEPKMKPDPKPEPTAETETE